MKSHFRYIIPIVAGLILFSAAFFVKKNQLPPMTIEVYGTSTDLNMMAVEDALFSVEEKFDDKVRIRMHYLSPLDEAGNFTSLQSQRLDGKNVSDEMKSFDIMENQRRLVMQKFFPSHFWPYIRLRNSTGIEVDWQPLARYIGLDAVGFQKKFSDFGIDMLQMEYSSFQAEQAHFDFVPSEEVLPFVIMNGKLYRGKTDLASMASEVAKYFLRKGRSELPSDHFWKVGSFSIPKPWEYAYRGVHECYSDDACQEKRGKIGVCENKNRLFAYCRYDEAPVVNIVVIKDDFDQNSDPYIKLFKKDFENISVNHFSSDSEEAKRWKKNPQLAFDPLYIFDAAIEKQPRFQTYMKNNLLIRLPDGRYAIASTLFRKETAPSSADAEVR